MDLTPFTIYLWQQADIAIVATALTCCGAAFASFMLILCGCMDGSMKRLGYKLITFTVFLVFVMSGLLAALLPSTKTLAYMWGIPATIEGLKSIEADKLPANMVKYLNLKFAEEIKTLEEVE